MTTKRAKRTFGTGVVIAVLVLAGCGAKPRVFNKSAIDQVNRIVVLPIESQADRAAGEVTFGLLLNRLVARRYDGLDILSPPVLWRIKNTSAADAGTLTRDQAVSIGRELEADAVLTGTMGYTVPMKADKSSKSPTGKGGKRDASARRIGESKLTLKLISVANGQDIYVHTAKRDGVAGDKVLRKTIDQAVVPLEQYLQSSRTKRKRSVR